ncbi:helix-turn-helix domain-containing protein [Streptacidiphilus sp. EB129]|uniref:helix-turn-helix domain-containing protein n=1 Tax=Streptacidiphilus sp. EB129 TaxID=3156262 RepID=UPI003516B51F
MAPRGRKRQLVDPATGEVVEAYETYRSREDTYQLGGSFTPVSDNLMVDLLHHNSGFTSTDRDVLQLHVHAAHGDRKTGPLRMTRQEIADHLGISLRTVAASIGRLSRANLIVMAETHGRISYYKAAAHVGSRDGGAKQRAQAEAQPAPLVPRSGIERKAS